MVPAFYHCARAEVGGSLVTKGGDRVPSGVGRTRHFHALCFRMWDNERHLLDWLHDVARAEGGLAPDEVAVRNLAESEDAYLAHWV
jgi:hypothetical protein